MDEIKNETNVEENYIDKMLSTTPQVNVIPKDKFEKRVKEVFEILWEKLSVTFGPGGSGTFVSVYPNYYNTKDGFSVMKNIGFREKIDQVITDMVMNICSRLNFTVGDGTTTAVIATRSMYESYQEKKPWFESKHILPRKILKEFESIKNELLAEIDKNAIPIRSDDP
jgi:chaperonin GroEL (HSP60 family)